MTQEELKYFKELLIAKRQETIDELEELKAITKERDEAGESSAYPFHMAELGTDAQEREKTFMFAERLNSYLNHLNEALYRIDNSVFGICSDCGNGISKERLEAVPQTKLCVDCKLKKK